MQHTTSKVKRKVTLATSETLYVCCCIFIYNFEN